jgi:hypothetical protein
MTNAPHKTIAFCLMPVSIVRTLKRFQNKTHSRTLMGHGEKLARLLFSLSFHEHGSSKGDAKIDPNYPNLSFASLPIRSMRPNIDSRQWSESTACSPLRRCNLWSFSLSCLARLSSTKLKLRSRLSRIGTVKFLHTRESHKPSFSLMSPCRGEFHKVCIRHLEVCI